jgi:bacterioferritin-associated ferredoxin
LQIVIIKFMMRFMIVCVCKNVSDRDIHAAMAGGATSLKQVRTTLGVSTCCGKCAVQVKSIVDAEQVGPMEQAIASAQASIQDAGVRLRSALYQPPVAV